MHSWHFEIAIQCCSAACWDIGAMNRVLGTPQSAELLLSELYIELRRKIRAWSAVTRQTPQARMGYVGQHLASTVTGFPGGRSGARGHDLELPTGGYAEIKTCYRVDQLGQCAKCHAAVSSIEDECPRCGSNLLERKIDSKWLIGVRNDEEMRTLFQPTSYYLVLFDFDVPSPISPDSGEESIITKGTPDINARIWQVDPRHPGFSMCMVDYYVNIRAKSKSKAPFNLWPYSLKFQLMRPHLIYHAVIKANDAITTLIFQHQIGVTEHYPIVPFSQMNRARLNLSDKKLVAFCESQQVILPTGSSRGDILQRLEQERNTRKWQDDWLRTKLAELIYLDGIRANGGEQWLPNQA